MKKLLFPILFACLAVLSSCDKDTPTPTPTNSLKKISEIYYEYESHDYISHDNGQTWNEYQSDYEDKVLRERWTWDGDKILSIENYSNLIYDNPSYNFYYNENNLVSEIIAPDIDERVIFTYSNNQISTMEFYSENVLSTTWELAYSNNKITQVNSTDSPFHITITWNGNNISKLTYSDNYDEAELLYTYDNKRNPYHDYDALLALSLIKEGEVTLALMSANNITSYAIQMGGMVYETQNYTYQYQNNYPTLKTEREEHEHVYTDPDYMTKHISEKRYYIYYLAD
jgi:hypothetical protein